MRSLTFGVTLAVACATLVPASLRATTADEALVKKLAPSMLALTRLIAAEKFAPRVDELIQRAPNAEALGAKWTSTLPAFQKARTAVSSRVTKVVDLYAASDELPGLLRKELDSYYPGPASAGLSTTLNGPTGPAVIYAGARGEFALAMMAENPDGPKVGDPAWMKQLGALMKTFADRIGPAVPAPDGAALKDAEAFLDSDKGSKFRQLWMSVIDRAMNDLDTGIQLMIFDNRDVIMKEINAAIATVK